MSLRLPLVIVAGIVEQLQSGDTLSLAASLYNSDSLNNGESSDALTICTPVYISGASEAKKAKASAGTTARVTGLWVSSSTSAGGTGECAVGGQVVASTAQWDAVTGDSGGLTYGDYYYLDPTTSGKLTKTAPTTVGQLVVCVGKAQSTGHMLLILERPILL